MSYEHGVAGVRKGHCPMHPKAKEAADKLAALRTQQAINEPPPRTEAPAPVRQSAPVVTGEQLEPAPAEQDAPSPEDSVVTQLSHWKQRSLSTEGVIKQQQTRYEAQLAAERERVAAIEKQAADERTAFQAQLLELQERSKVPPPPPNISEFFTEEMVLEQGEDNMLKMIDGMTKLVERRVNDGIAAATAPLKQELTSLKADRVNGQRTEAQRRHTAFINAVNTAIPGWEKWATVETSGPEFNAYFSARVPGYRLTRQQALDEAWKAQDSVSVVELLQSFLDSMGQPVAIQSQESRQLPAGRDAGGSAAPPGGGPIMWLDEVEKFRSDYSHGAYRKRPKEAAEMINKMTRARSTPGGIQAR